MKPCYEKLDMKVKRTINVTASPSCDDKFIVWPEADAYLRKRDAEIKQAGISGKDKLAIMTMDQKAAVGLPTGTDQASANDKLANGQAES